MRLVRNLLFHLAPTTDCRLRHSDILCHGDFTFPCMHSPNRIQLFIDCFSILDRPFRSSRCRRHGTRCVVKKLLSRNKNFADCRYIIIFALRHWSTFVFQHREQTNELRAGSAFRQCPGKRDMTHPKQKQTQSTCAKAVIPLYYNTIVKRRLHWYS